MGAKVLLRTRTCAKNEAHAVLARNLCGRPPISDRFGTAGRKCSPACSCRSTSG